MTKIDGGMEAVLKSSLHVGDAQVLISSLVILSLFEPLNELEGRFANLDRVSQLEFCGVCVCVCVCVCVISQQHAFKSVQKCSI